MKTNLRKLTVAWPLVIFLLFPALTRAETAVQAWVQRCNGPGNGDDYANAVAVNGGNNVILTGTWLRYGDYATIKYSSSGTCRRGLGLDASEGVFQAERRSRPGP